MAAIAILLLGGPPIAGGELSCLETPNLRLVWNAPIHSFVAPYTAQCFENSFRLQRRLFGYTSSERVNVILDDVMDYSNAGVWVSPRSSMVVHLAPVNFVYETGPSNERINFTMNHEGVHVIALDQAAGSDRFFRALFRGKVRETSEHPETMLYSYLTMPRRAAPRWYHEGVAVFLETWLSGGIGRAQGPFDEMVFRSKVRDGTRIYDPLGLESEGTAVDFQVGVNSYLYGTRFISYLAYRYKPEAVIEWASRGPGSRAYFARQFREVFGLPLGQAWREWIAWEREFQQANLDSIRRYPTTPSRDLSPRALGSVSRAHVDPEAHLLYAGVQYPGTVAHIAAIPLDGGEIRKLVEIKDPALYFVSSIAYDARRKILFYTTDNNAWRDLCAYDVTTRKARVLIRDARIGDLAFSPRDSSLWGVRHFNGISTLVRMADPYREWNQVVSWPFGRDVFDLDVSPDGSRLCASVAEINGKQSLQLFDIRSLSRADSSGTRLHDFGTAIPTSFVFSPDGRYLYGSSYYTGASNIWRYNLDADSMEIVTNCETGMFRPVPLDGDSVIVFRYTGEGFVPALIEARPLQDVSATVSLGWRITQKHPVVQDWIAPSPASIGLDSLTTYSGPYRALGTFGLTSLYPVVEGYKEYVAVGLHADASDAIGLHSVGLTVSHSPAAELPGNERWHGRLGYKRNRVGVKLSYNGASFYDLAGPKKSSRKGYGASLTYTRPLVDDAPRNLNLTSTLSGYGDLERLPDQQNVATSSGFEKLLAGQVELAYRNLRSSLGAVDAEKGWKWSLTSSAHGVRFGRPGGGVWRGFPLFEGALDLGTPIPIRNSSLWLRTAAGFSPGDPDEPFANFFFGGFGNNWVDYQEVKRYREASSFPGVELDGIGGTNYVKALLDWNLPPLRFRRVGKPALYASWIRLSLFGGGIRTQLEDASVGSRVANLGAQADLRVRALSHQTLTVSAGYARAFERGAPPRREWMASVRIL